MLCDEAYHIVEMLTYAYPIEIESVDIYSDNRLLEKYHLHIPVIQINGEEFYGEDLTFDKLERFVQEYIK